MKKILIVTFISFFGLMIFGQTKDLVETDGITTSLHKKNIGKITFMNGNIPIDQYKESDFLKTFPLAYRSDLNIRVFMDNSVTNYLHLLAPELTAEQLLEKGNLQFIFYIDNQLIYKENISPGCWLGNANELKNTLTTFRIPLTSTKGENLWALHLWERFQINGGEKVLTDGKHKLKIEIRPYIKVDENDAEKVGQLIAEGEVELIKKTPKATAEQMAIQTIMSESGWEISNFKFDRKKIEALNSEIATYNLKDITSIVVIHEGKLLLEEYFNGADRNTLHDPRSAGKSFASTIMGIAIRDGYIKDENATLNEFYDLKNYDNYDLKKEQVKIKDLLTMSSVFEGSDANSSSPGNEENMYPTDNWVDFTLNLPSDPTKTNGGKWDYFTAGTILLGDILDKKVPNGLERFADEKLFKPLNITKYKWQFTPQNVANTAGSLQMRSLDYAKYAQLYKNNGNWNGYQILPKGWIEKTFTHQINIEGRENEFYSYLFWNKMIQYKGKNYETYYCSGNGGNEFIIFQDLPLVIIITSKAYNKPYGHPQADRIVKDFLLPSILR